MKIGIITYVNTATCNYGAELQAYALQHKLNELGYNTEVVNLRRELPGNGRFKETVKKAVKVRFQRLSFFQACASVFTLVRSVVKDRRYAKKYSDRFAEKKQMFHNFFMQRICHSACEYTPADMDVAELPYDTFIAGSDQIWNYKNSDRVDVFFLMFADRLGAKKISYAASFSVSEIPNEYQTQYTAWINNIDFLSVREYAGIEIVKQLTGRKASLVCDPTLLLNKGEWAKQFEEPKNPLVEGKYVVIYSMSRSTNVMKLAKNIACELGGIKVVNIKLNFTPSKNDGILHLDFVSPTQWVWLLLHAEYVVTDSFHGTAFSINFNKSFTTVQNPLSDLNSRVDTILTKLGLIERLYVDDGRSFDKIALQIDYAEVNQKLDEWRKESMNFLINALNADK